ncbi:Uncharacterised protein [Mycobacteroides abscessus subsp. abscessus]|nr:Uncharacterised protein [Mycobacteroides abscessus subsp. abscessus]
MAAAIASGSHEWNGNCADFVIAATATRTATSVVTAGWVAHTSETRASWRFVVPVAAIVTPTATRRVSPPMKVMSRVRRDGACPGEPERAMRKNEASEVSSQHTKRTMRSLLSTSATIEKVKTTMSQ